MELKACSKCKTRLSRKLFYIDKRRTDGLRLWCKACDAAKARERYLANHEKEDARSRAWAKANPERIKRTQKAYRSAHHAASIEYERRCTQELRDSYISALLCASTGLRPPDITSNLIEAKRLHLKIQRLIKEKRK